MLPTGLPRLRELREAAGLSRTTLARRTGLRLATIKDVEDGRKDPITATIHQIAAVLGVSPDEMGAPPGADLGTRTGTVARVPGLQRLREQAGLTTGELGRAIGVTGTTIRRYERGEHSLRRATVDALAEALGVAPGELLGADDGLDAAPPPA